jgi:hypothetical protein
MAKWTTLTRMPGVLYPGTNVPTVMQTQFQAADLEAAKAWAAKVVTTKTPIPEGGLIVELYEGHVNPQEAARLSVLYGIDVSEFTAYPPRPKPVAVFSGRAGGNTIVEMLFSPDGGHSYHS